MKVFNQRSWTQIVGSPVVPFSTFLIAEHNLAITSSHSGGMVDGSREDRALDSFLLTPLPTRLLHPLKRASLSSEGVRDVTAMCRQPSNQPCSLASLCVMTSPSKHVLLTCFGSIVFTCSCHILDEETRWRLGAAQK